MTAALLDRASTRLPATRQTRRPAGPKLRVLDQVASRRRARHRSALLILFVAVLVGFFAVAFVHAELVAGQHELDAVRTEISQAEARHAELARAVEEASAPAQIVTRATELGMVRARQPVYLTAAAPVRAIEVSPSLANLVTPRETTDGTNTQVAASGQPATAVPANADQLQGSIGQAGGISAAIRIQDTPTVAIGTDSPDSPIGASTATASATPSTETGAATVVTTTPPAATASSGPVSSIAGTRAASVPGSTSPETDSNVGQAVPADTNPAGGLASAAATTSG